MFHVMPPWENEAVLLAFANYHSSTVWYPRNNSAAVQYAISFCGAANGMLANVVNQALQLGAAKSSKLRKCNWAIFTSCFVNNV